MTPTELALRYFETVKTRDVDRFVALFAEDASMIYPDGREAKGRAAIREHQAPVYSSASPPTPEAQSIIAGDGSAAVEVAARLPDGRVFNMANCFYFNADGLIERLRIYRRG
jgi:ketosteroid isomerase-like protein